MKIYLVIWINGEHGTYQILLVRAATPQAAENKVKRKYQSGAASFGSMAMAVNLPAWIKILEGKSKGNDIVQMMEC